MKYYNLWNEIYIAMNDVSMYFVCPKENKISSASVEKNRWHAEMAKEDGKEISREEWLQQANKFTSNRGLLVRALEQNCWKKENKITVKK